MKIEYVDTMQFEKIDLENISEGDRVIMTYSAHNYERDGAGVLGEVIKTPRDHPEIFEEFDRPVVDFVIQGEDGNRYKWEVDNGYVTGPNEGRGSDIGKMTGFYPPKSQKKVED